MKLLSLHVGVDSDDSPDQSNSFTADATAMRALSVSRGAAATDAVLLTGDGATAAAVKKAWEALVARTTAADVLFVTFACHGYPSQGTRDALCLWADTALEDKDVVDILARLPDGALVVIVVDACSSEGFADPNTVTASAFVQAARRAMNRLWTRLGRAPTRRPSNFDAASLRARVHPGPGPHIHVFAAAKKLEFANADCDDGVAKRGCFSLAFAQALSKLDRPTMSRVASEIAHLPNGQVTCYEQLGNARGTDSLP